MRPVTTPPEGAGASGDDLLNEAEAATYLKIPAATLRQHRYLGVGAPYSKLGKHVRYRRRELDEWIESQTVRPA
jgi:Helix-turn-helix domain